MPLAAGAQVSTMMIKKKPAMNAAPNLSIIKPVCSDAQTSRLGDSTTSCEPYACNGATGRCLTAAHNSGECANGYLWWQPNNTCQHCDPTANNIYWDDTSHSCKTFQ